MSNNGSSKGVTGGINMKFNMEALSSEVKRMFRAKLEQFHEKIEQSLEQPRNPLIGRRREKLRRRGVWVEEEEYERDGFEDGIDHDLVVSDRRYGGRLREARNRKDNNLSNIKMKILSFQGKMTPRHILSGRERWSWFFVVTIILKIRR